MNTETRNAQIDEIFELTAGALKKELQAEEVSDKMIVAALRFLDNYETERLPQPGSAAQEDAEHPYPINAHG